MKSVLTKLFGKYTSTAALTASFAALALAMASTTGDAVQAGGTVGAEVEGALTLVASPSIELHFGRFAPSSTAVGTVVVDAVLPVNRTAPGGIVSLLATGTPASPGEFTITGPINAFVDITLPAFSNLTSATTIGIMQATQFVHDAGATPGRIDDPVG